MPTCQGCYRSFTSKGYASHLSQTTNPECNVLSRILQEELGWASNEFEDPANVDGGGEFHGDYFGREYGPRDLPGIYDDGTLNTQDSINYLDNEYIANDDVESDEEGFEDDQSSNM